MTQDDKQHLIQHYSQRLISDAEFRRLFAPAPLALFRPMLGSAWLAPIFVMWRWAPTRQPEVGTRGTSMKHPPTLPSRFLTRPQLLTRS